MELVEIHSIPISDVAVSTNDMGTFPYQMVVCVDDMGNMELCQIHSISIQKGEGSYGIGMGLIHIIPIPITMENLWNCAKYVAILKTIESKLNEDSGIYGFDMEAIAHTKAIYYPYMGHSLCHTISILGPYMAHITRFGKGTDHLSLRQAIKERIKNCYLFHSYPLCLFYWKL